jgi:RNA polymerase sigma factor (sigma-70 family)
LDLTPHAPSKPPDCAAPLPPAAPEISALTRRLVAGDEAAYRMFYALYFDRLTRYLIVVNSGDEQAARDGLQGLLVRLVRHIRVFDDEAVFWSWLTVLARSANADERRTRRRYFAFLDRFTRHTEIVAAIEGTPPRDDRLGESLARHLALLPADERELIEWKYTERRTVREIAAQLDATEKTVESRLTRIRRKLKEAVLVELKS